jgi:hypothetical protein
MLAQLDDDSVGHHLEAMNLRRMTPVYHGVPPRLGVGMNRHLEVAGADSLLHDLLEFDRGLLLLIHAATSNSHLCRAVFKKRDPFLRPGIRFS